MTMALTADEVADVGPPCRDIFLYTITIGGGIAAVAYGAVTENWPVMITGIVAILGGLTGLLFAIGILIAKMRAIRNAHANAGDGGGDNNV